MSLKAVARVMKDSKIYLQRRSMRGLDVVIVSCHDQDGKLSGLGVIEDKSHVTALPNWLLDVLCTIEEIRGSSTKQSEVENFGQWLLDWDWLYDSRKFKEEGERRRDSLEFAAEIWQHSKEAHQELLKVVGQETFDRLMAAVEEY